ncbi:UDP-N-acetylglucosamine 2-epimerase (non-hydrolyzing) [Microbacterium sp. BE35]|uniref:UDP-N-acetylglucosamine 2-epimerase n=1 Tax=Microbacterium sp. BE35 TaxID=2817773 RepID=UPI002854CCAA|nr:UDP-N-acetylglucosamine 2-epimerase [Microbacterium sp. BE35]MDR7189105.1 UDP-N-acetylglucosamine 2-epimerase (non-hydrolyzing) [Microbacterium sp. BE35]
MIVFIYGTTAEAIKLAPIARRLDARGIPYEHWVTQQHTDALRVAMPQLGFRAPDRVIADGWRGKPLKTPLQMVGWMFDVGIWTLRNLRSIRKSLPRNSVVIVHGDTVTTVLGTFIGRLAGAPVAHVEAGLRSGDWRHPFPEELDRRIVGRLAQIHYAPAEEAAANLAGRANVVMTHGNTVVDAVRDAAAGRIVVADEEYGLVLLHRFEFISNPQLVRDTLVALDQESPLPMKVVVDSYSRDTMERTIASFGLQKFSIMAKQEHSEFVDTLRAAAFIVTDSGGVQEEAAVFGLPTLVHRMATERSEGIGTTAMLSLWDLNRVREFLRSTDAHRGSKTADPRSPSDIVVDDLVDRGLAQPA